MIENVSSSLPLNTFFKIYINECMRIKNNERIFYSVYYCVHCYVVVLINEFIELYIGYFLKAYYFYMP